MSPIILLIVVVVAAVAAGAGYFIGYNPRKKPAEAQIGSEKKLFWKPRTRRSA